MLSLSQNDKLSAWLRLDILPAFNFFTQFGYVFQYTTDEGSADFYFNTDSFNPLELLKIVETLKFSGEIIFDSSAVSLISYQAGRYQVADVSASVINTALDGAEGVVRFPESRVRAGCWYNGFIDKNISNILISSTDLNLYEDADQQFSSPRLVQQAVWTFTNLGGQSMSIFAAAQEDLRSADDLATTGGSLFHSLYVGGALNGIIASNLSYNIYAVVGTGSYMYPKTDTSVLMLAQMYKAELRYFLKGALSPVIGATAVYSSGDDWDRADWEGSSFTADKEITTLFIPISARKNGYVFSAALGNLCFLEASYSFRPVEPLQLSFRNAVFFRAENGPMDAEVSKTSTDLFLGNEISLRANFRPLSDVGTSLSAGLFFPNQDVLTGKDIEFRANLYLSLSF
jgi:hypothetical protein